MWSLLEQKPLSRLGKLSRARSHEAILELASAYSLDKNEIYFDRDPHMFTSILDYYRCYSHFTQHKYNAMTEREKTRSTRPIDAKLSKKLCLWIMFDIKISHYQTPLYQRSNISDILKCFVNDTSKTFDIIDRLEKPEILSNWNFWIIWNLCKRIFIFPIFIQGHSVRTFSVRGL